LKNKKLLYLFMALLCAIIAAGSVYYYLAELEAQAREATEFDLVLVANETIPPRTRVSADMFEEKEFPAGYVHPDAARSAEDISGGITKSEIHSGEQVLQDKIAIEGETDDGFAYTISEGKRALSVEVNEVVAVGGLLLPGDHVDIIATLELEPEEEQEARGSTSMSKVIIENIRVLAVGQNYDAHSGQAGSVEAQTVTLEVDPEDGPALTMATERGNIRMMLRSPVDEASVPTEAWQMQDFR